MRHPVADKVRVVVLLSLLSTMADAHHSYTRFDMSSSVTLQGTVKEFQWTNPHVWIQLVVKDPAGGADAEWSIESDSPNMLARRGWTRRVLKPGDVATVVAHPLKIHSDKHEGALESISVNGQRIGVAAPAGEPRP